MTKTQTKKSKGKVDRLPAQNNVEAPAEEKTVVFAKSTKKSARSKRREIRITYKPNDEIEIRILGSDDEPPHEPDPDFARMAGGDEPPHEPDPD